MKITQDIVSLIQAALHEDLNDVGDITSQSTINPNQEISASMHARENGVVAGVLLVQRVFQEVDKNIKIEIFIEDGQNVTKGQEILTITGNAQNILTGERVALNFISHLSGIATETAKYVEAVKSTKAKILDTRKTLPAYRALQKYAVKMGGGENHRFGLYDMILIKDNHIAAAGSVSQALNAAKNSNHDVKIEIEVDTLDQLDEVLAHAQNGGGADIVMLDNMAPDLLKQAVKKVKGQMLTEASGGVNLDTVRAIAESGVDYISIGALTHSVKVFDIGLDIK